METQTQSNVGRMTNMNSTKVIKRYQNRKLYDTQQSCYVTLDDIAKMIRANEEVTIVDNKTKRDITASTLAQIIFEAEKKSADYAPLSVLREIIQNSNGSMSSFLAKLGVFKPEAKKEEKVFIPGFTDAPRSFDDVKSNLDNRIAAASEKPIVDPTKNLNVETTPELPNANNRNLNN